MHGVEYIELFGANLVFPELLYDWGEMELTAHDKFVVEFCDYAETLKDAYLPQRVLPEFITFNLRTDQMERFTSERWWWRGGPERETAMKDMVWRTIESRISTMMKLWWEQTLPASLQRQIYPIIPSTGKRFGSLRDRPDPIFNPEAAHERQFFGMEAPLALEASARRPRDPTTSGLVARLEHQALRLGVDGLTSTLEIEAASEICLITRAAASGSPKTGSDTVPSPHPRIHSRAVVGASHAFLWACLVDT